MKISKSVNHEVTGSNPVEVLNFFQASLRNCINCVHCDDHFFIFKKNNVISVQQKRTNEVQILVIS